MKKEPKVKNQEKKKIDITQIFTKIMAAILVIIMLAATAATIIFALI